MLLCVGKCMIDCFCHPIKSDIGCLNRRGWNAAVRSGGNKFVCVCIFFVCVWSEKENSLILTIYVPLTHLLSHDIPWYGKMHHTIKRLFSLLPVCSITERYTPLRFTKYSSICTPKLKHCHRESERQALYGGLYDSDWNNWIPRWELERWWEM